MAALALLPVVLFPIWKGGLWFELLLVAGGVLMLLEWLVMTGVKTPFLRAIGIAAVAALAFWQPVVLGPLVPIWSLALVLLAGTRFTLPARYYQPQDERRRHVGWLLTGIAYVGLPIFALGWIRVAEGGALAVLWVFLVVWATDVGGYFAGKGLGGPKLAPRISPKKTWAGLLGGMALAAGVSAAMAWIVADMSGAPWHHPGGLALAALPLAVLAQLGDLYESRMKRFFGIKDSGHLIPGHGGLLDRVDGLVFVAPAVATYMAVGAGAS
ncbi:phosphatidate cytidylyltransferase [Yunchengibacter salinarum]|uniref:phosphatidate cytidylyltransferase n=1 Tax=Yunchengibacter salinarum TaxID=3133399 RepID=UPI0035B61278